MDWLRQFCYNSAATPRAERGPVNMYGINKFGISLSMVVLLAAAAVSAPVRADNLLVNRVQQEQGMAAIGISDVKAADVERSRPNIADPPRSARRRAKVVAENSSGLGGTVEIVAL